VIREDGSSLPVEDHPVGRVLRTGRPERDVVLGLRTPARGLRWLSVSAELDRDADGRTRGVVVTLLDVTLRQAVVEEARALSERLTRVIEGSQDGFWDWDVPSGRVAYSERWASMLGYRREELEPHLRTWERLVHPDDLGRVETLVRALLDGATDHYECEHRVMRKDGSYAWVLDRGKVIAADSVEGLTEKTAGRGETLVRVGGPEASVLGAVRAVAGIDDVEVTDRGADGTLTLTVRSRSGPAVRPQLARLLVERGCTVHELSPRLMSLEDLFVDILARSGRKEGQP
jgi:PAS domain S-box-containing protein